MTDTAQPRTDNPGLASSEQDARADLSEAPFVDAEQFSVELEDHRFWFYPAGVDRLKALVELIDQAQRDLHLFYYLFQADYSGHQVRDALVRAGVEVSEALLQGVPFVEVIRMVLREGHDIVIKGAIAFRSRNRRENTTTSMEK